MSAFVGSADARTNHLSKAQKRAISHKLYRAIKQNPRLISKRWFLKKASAVNFSLPTTIRLLPCKDQGTAPVAGTNCHYASNDNASLLDNYATIDLGPSLGTRTIGLGGYVKANINFNDAFDGGNLGDVRLSIPSGGQLTTSSVPLLANPNTSDAANHLAPEDELQHVITAGAPAAGGTFSIKGPGGTDTAASFPYNPATFSADLKAALAKQDSVCGTATAVATPCPQNVYTYSIPGTAANPALPAASVYTAFMVGGTRSGISVNPFTTVGTTAGVILPPAFGGGPAEDVAGTQGLTDADGFGGCGDFQGGGPAAPDIDKLGSLTNSMDVNSTAAGDPVAFPGNPALTPSPDYGGSTNVQDTVLRTGPINLGVVAGGTDVTIPGDGALNQVKAGSSGGKANLFGNPVNGLGSGNSVDVTIGALQGNIYSIARQVDGAFPGPAGGPNANEQTGNISAYFNCRQAWTGGIQNTLTDVKLKGKLAISPALTADGHVRIAKVSLTGNGSSRQALAACLSPSQLFMSGNPFVSGALPDPYETGTDTFTVGPQLMGVGANSFNPLAVLLGSHLGASAEPTSSCDTAGGPLQRPPFNYHRISTTSYDSSDPDNVGLDGLLTDGAAVAVSGDLKVQRVRGEVIIGDVGH